MKREMTRLTVFAMALALALPAVMGAEQSEAFAVGSIVSSRSGGKRTHKAAAKKSSSSSSSSSNSGRTTSRTTTTRTPTHRTSGGTTTRTTTTRRPAGTTTHSRTSTTRTRVNERPRYAPGPQHRHSTTTVSGGRRTTTTTTTTTTRTRSGRRHYYDNGPVYYSPAPARRTTVNNHYYYGNTQQPPPATVYEDNYREEQVSEESHAQAYITGTVGLGGLAAPAIADGALPGVDFNLGLGGRSEWVALEMGFGMGGYRLDPDASASDLLLLGTSLDVKLQPSIGFLEPYVMAGVGGQYLSDYVADTSALGGSVRLGAGLDLRFDDLAVTMRYTFSQHGWLEDERGVYGDGALSAQTESLAVGLTLYF